MSVGDHVLLASPVVTPERPLVRWSAPLLVSAAYLLLSAAVTWPLLRDIRTRVAGGTTDPVLNMAVLVWNATVTPFTGAWWNPPHFFPARGVVAFTENLVGISPTASPVFWLTGNGVLAYNVAVFLTWPMSAVAAYLLVRMLTGREDAGFLGGLAFAFSPYRAVAFPHIQTLATFGIAVSLIGAHGYLARGRWPWLALAGLGWLQQALANGYYVAYGALFIAMWWFYFCSTAQTARRGLALVATWMFFSLPLVPMLLRYRAIHDQYGLHRTYTEILYFSALTHSWLEAHDHVWLWSRVLSYGKDNLFPGLTVLVVVAAGLVRLMWASRVEAEPAASTLSRRRLRSALQVGAIVALASIVVNLFAGRIDTTFAGVPVKMTDVGRAVLVLIVCGVPWLALTPLTRDALARRSPLVFYVAAALGLALLSFGPEFRSAADVIWKPAPYGWLMRIPGFDEIRVPTQLKMIDLLCLSVSAALAYCALCPRPTRRAALVCAIVAGGLLLDGWIVRAEMAPAPELWPTVEIAGRAEPILELPLGDGDYGATYRASLHHRPVMNGVSGYDPPHYYALKHGLDTRNPAMLRAIASLGDFDIVVDSDQDLEGSALLYARSAPAARELASDGRRTLLRVPGVPAAAEPGERWPIASVQTAHHEETKALMIDGDPGTGWADLPDEPSAWVIADLGLVRDVGGLSDMVGDYPRDFPRRLTIETSVDGQLWEQAWDGPTDAEAFLAFVRAPRQATLRFTFDARKARYVRLRETDRPTNWRIQELQVHAPAPAGGLR